MKNCVAIVALMAGLSVGHVLAQAPSAAIGAPVASGTWQVDGNHTAAQFSVKHMMVSTVRGTLGKVSGTIEYDGKSANSIKAEIAVDVTGINTGTENRDKDLRSENFFDVAKYPTITFKSNRVEPAGPGKLRLVGDLTMHGVTKEVALDVEGPSPVLQSNGAQRVGASATAKLNRRDFGLQYNRMIEAAPVVGDEILVQIDIEANRK